MKKKITSLIALILVLAMIVPSVVSCSFGSSSSSSSSGTKDTSSTDTETSKDESSSSSDASTSDTGNNTGDSSSTTGDDTDDTASSNKTPVIKYLRIRELAQNYVLLRLNTNLPNAEYEVRYSDEEITESNFAAAKTATVSIDKGDGYIDIKIIGMSADENNMYYVGVQAKNNDNLSSLETVRAGGIQIIDVGIGSNDSQIYSGEVLRDFSYLFDENSKVGDPRNEKYKTIPSTTVPEFKITEEVTNNKNADGDQLLGPIVDLLNLCYVDSIYVYYGATSYPLSIRSSKNSATYDVDEEWDNGEVEYNPDAKKWTEIKIEKEVQYIQLLFADGQAPTEVLIYGYVLSEGEVEVSTKEHKNVSIGELLGACALVNSSYEQLNSVNVIREYHNLDWSYSYDSFPKKTFTLSGTPNKDMTTFYKTCYGNGLTVVPCVQWPNTLGGDVARYYVVETGKIDNSKHETWSGSGTYVLDNPVKNIDKFDPMVYLAYADVMFQYAARFGHNSSDALKTISLVHTAGSAGLVKVGFGYIDWLEFGNEPNGEDSLGYSAYQLAALQSAAYDGHMKTLLADLYDDDTYFLGAKNADPSIKVAMAGLAGIQTTYIKEMCYWMRANRTGADIVAGTNDSIAMDAFNVHTYFGKSFTMNGQTVTVGVSPEEWDLAGAMSGLLEYRNKYYPDCEVWLTEFGWDTNYSYLTPTAAHAYAEYSSWQVQAMWLTRAYLILSAVGVDKATMYMMLDATSQSDDVAVGKYGTCGIVTYGGTFKDGYYYLYTLKNTLSDYTFTREIDSGNGNVWVYEYKTEDGKTAYAVWCPTSDGTKVQDFQLNIGSGSATMVTAVNGNTEGEKTTLIANGGTVTFNVSENPVYILVD